MSMTEVSPPLGRPRQPSVADDWFESLLTDFVGGESAAARRSISGVHMRWLDQGPRLWLDTHANGATEDDMRPRTVADALMRRAAALFSLSWQACFVQLSPHHRDSTVSEPWSLLASCGDVPASIASLRLTDPFEVTPRGTVQIPLIHAGRTLGTWLVGTHPEAELDRDDERLLRKLARQVVASLEVAVLRGQLARYERSVPTRAPIATGQLTEREAQVAACLVSGMTNLQIASALQVREGTVAKHIEHIMTKLHFQSRAQIAVWAADRVQQSPEEYL